MHWPFFKREQKNKMEEEEETSPEIEIEEASDDNLEESTNDQEIGGPDLPLDLLTVP